jgi:cytochrome c-type biogenesis protein CcmH
LFVADALARSGNHRGAARAVLGGVRSAPDNLPLWTWAGVTLARADGDTMSPAAQMAFRRARALNPDHPAPWFFEGMALARAGEFDRVRPYWLRAYQVSREGSQYRPEIAARIYALDQFLAMRGSMMGR